MNSANSFVYIIFAVLLFEYTLLSKFFYSYSEVRSRHTSTLLKLSYPQNTNSTKRCLLCWSFKIVAASTSITLPNFIQMGPKVVKHFRFRGFQKLMTAGRHHEFSKFQIFNGKKLVLDHLTKFRKDLANRWWDTAFFSIWRPSVILDFRSLRFGAPNCVMLSNFIYTGSQKTRH